MSRRFPYGWQDPQALSGPPRWSRLRLRRGLRRGLGPSQRRPCQLDAVGVVQEPVTDRIGLIRVANDRMPVRDRELTGDEGRGALGAIFDHLGEVATFGVAQRRE